MFCFSVRTFLKEKHVKKTVKIHFFQVKPFYEDTAFISLWTRQSPDVDSVRTAKDRERGEVREGRWRRIQ